MHLAQCQSSSSWEILIKHARGGCRGCRGQLFNECRGYLLAIANQRLEDKLRGKLGASDLVQQTLLHAHRDFEDFRGRSENELLAWLQSILLNEAARARRDYLATAKRDVTREVTFDHREGSHAGESWLPASCETPSKQAAAREEDVRLQQAIARLSAPYRRVISLRSRDQRTFAEIGNLMAIGESRARRLWVRAIERLRRELTAEDDRRTP